MPSRPDNDSSLESVTRSIGPVGDPRPILEACWRDWSGRCRLMSVEDWETATRCGGWSVHALVAHVAPDPDAMSLMLQAEVDGEPQVSDAADLLRRFNAPDGVAHSMAGFVADAALVAAAELDADALMGRFERGADLAASSRQSLLTVLPHPVAGSVTLAVVLDIALMEATVHLLDLIAAIGGPPPGAEALRHVSVLLARVSDPIAFIEVVTGRRPAAGVLPAVV